MSCANKLATAMAAIQRPLDDSFFQKSTGCGASTVCKSAPRRTVDHSQLVDLIMRNQEKAHKAIENYKDCTTCASCS